MPRATGLQISETSVRVLDLDGSARKYRIMGAAEVPIEKESREDPDALVRATRAAFKAAKAKKEHVVLGIPAKDAIIREIQVPFTDLEQIRKVIKFEAETHLHGIDIEDVVVDFHRIAHVGGRSRLLIIAIRKSVLRRYLALLSKAGVDPHQVDIDACALFSLSRLIDEVEDVPDDQGQVILDLGETNSTFVVSMGEHLRMVRCVRMGSDSITRSLTSDLGIEWGEAENVTREFLHGSAPFALAEDTGGGPERSPSAALTATELRQDIVRDKGAAFDRRIIGELRRTLSSVQLEGRLGAIWLTGLASTSPTLPQSLEEAFGVPVAHLDVFQRATHTLDEEAALFLGSASGLALKGVGHDPLKLEFRREELRFTRRFEKIQTPLFVGSIFLLLLFVLLAADALLQVRRTQGVIDLCAKSALSFFKSDVVDAYRNQEQELKILGYENAEELVREYERLEALGDEQMTLVRRTNFTLSRPLENIRRKYGIGIGDQTTGGPETQVTSALHRLEQFLKGLEEAKDELGGHRIYRLNVSSEEVSWDMQVNAPRASDALTEAFKKLDGYESYVRGMQDPSPDTKFAYRIRNNRLTFRRERR